MSKVDNSSEVRPKSSSESGSLNSISSERLAASLKTASQTSQYSEGATNVYWDRESVASTSTLDGKKAGEKGRVTRQHWKPDRDAQSCENRACSVRFSLTRRRHHCRRCGLVFCYKCCSQRAPLDFNANFVYPSFDGIESPLSSYPALTGTQQLPTPVASNSDVMPFFKDSYYWIQHDREAAASSERVCADCYRIYDLCLAEQRALLELEGFVVPTIRNVRSNPVSVGIHAEANSKTPSNIAESPSSLPGGTSPFGDTIIKVPGALIETKTDNVSNSIIRESLFQPRRQPITMPLLPKPQRPLEPLEPLEPVEPLESTPNFKVGTENTLAIQSKNMANGMLSVPSDAYWSTF